MLSRCIFTRPLQLSRRGRTVSSSQVRHFIAPKGIYNQDPVYMYATKDNASPAHEPDPAYGRNRLRLYLKRVWDDVGLRWMLLLCTGGLVTSFYFFNYSKNYMTCTDGLLGPKWKRPRSRLTVVLDLDETLVSYGDKAFRQSMPLVQRPFLGELLDYLSEIDAEVVIWTASSERYLREALQQIDPLGTRISRTIARDTTWYSNDDYYEKNVVWLNRNLADTIIIENRALAVRSCNYNAILVPDFIRGEYMESGQDFPTNDQSLRLVKEIIADLQLTGMSVPIYLADRVRRHKDIQEIPCHFAIRQAPDEMSKGTFFFVSDKFILERQERQEAILI